MTMSCSISSFEAALKEARATSAAFLNGAIKQEGRIAAAMRYATQGGKGLRAFLALESARLHGFAPDAALPAAAAIEAIHAYSLIHDDLPCMDDDDLRRGQPTVHRKWDEATAVLAGDALQSLGFELVTRCNCTAEARITLVSTLAHAAGVAGMVGGQALDIEAETANLPLTLDEITTLQQGKTGALIGWSSMVGPRMAITDTTALKTYADALGLAFQIADDILDVQGDAAVVGKATGKDAEAGKATFVSLLGLEAAIKHAETLVEEACDSLSVYGNAATTLKNAARFVITRSH